MTYGAEKNASPVSVVVPVFNEPTTVEKVVKRLLCLPIVGQIVLVDDGSDQETSRLLCSLAEEDRVDLLRHDKNRGKGAAISTGFANVTGDIVVIQDADLEYQPENIPGLVEPILQNEADVVYGSRYRTRGQEVGPLTRRMANWVLTRLSNMMTGLSLTDMETGHKAFSREVLSEIEIQEERFGVEPELTAKVAKQGWRVSEVPVSYSPRSYDDGKKIGWVDGVRALWCIIRYRWRD